MPDTRILLIPLDNRPVTYSLPGQIAELNKEIEIMIPPREMIGGLYHNTKIDSLLLWLNDILNTHKVDYMVCCLDTLAYGGLIPSRRSNDTEAMVQARLEDFRKLVENHKQANNTKIYAFSSIMRISNNNINEEEKEYWDNYGELIFKCSYLAHRISELDLPEDKEAIFALSTKIPAEILEDYMDTRDRNFNINKFYLDWIKEGFIDYLVYSQDDTAEWGFNVQEAKTLKDLILENKLYNKATVITGADEIPCDLLVKALVDKSGGTISIYPAYSTENGPNVISRYEDRPIMKSAQGQINLCGAKIADSLAEADLALLINTPNEKQNDHAMRFYSEPEDEEAVKLAIDFINNSNKPVIVADVKFANGADDLFVRKFLENGISLCKIYGFAAWNTTGNTLGSVISMALSRYLAEKHGNLNGDKFKKLLLIRFGDDWAYQSVVRQKIRAKTKEADLNMLSEELTPMIKNIAGKLNLTLKDIKLSYPWNRTFEVEIDI